MFPKAMSLRWCRVVLAAATAAAILSTNAALAAAQAGGTIRGRVTDTRDQRPVEGARVSVSGSAIQAATNRAGNFTLTNVPAGQVVLQVRLLGYSPVSNTVTVTAGETTTADFSITQAAVSLDEVIVTGTAGGSQARTIGNAVGSIQVAEIERKEPVNVQRLMGSEVPGVRVRLSSGQLGTGGAIKIRGVGSLVLGNEPIIFVDGVRIDNTANENSAAFRSASSRSRLNDIDPNEIEKIEIIKGPAAATLYGTEASSGVIQVITKKGQAGAARFDVALSGGGNFYKNPEKLYPPVYGKDPTTGDIVSVNLVAQEAARGTPIFTTGQIRNLFVSMAGSAQDVRYYLSVDGGHEGGVVSYQWMNKLQARANLAYSPGANSEVGINLGFVRNRHQTGSTEQPITHDIMWGSPLTVNTPLRGFLRRRPEDYETLSGVENIDRIIGNLYVKNTLFNRLRQSITVGGDFGNTRSFSLWPRTAIQPGPFPTSAGRKTVLQDRTSYTTVDYLASVQVNATHRLSLEQSAGVQYYTKQSEILSGDGQVFPVPGVETISATATKTATEDFLQNKTLGLYVQEKVGWNNRLFLTGALRGDDNSAFGENFDFVTYPKASLSWVVNEEPFWHVPLVNTLKLRAAWGRAGQQPDIFAATRLYAPTTGPGGAATLTPSNIGNPDLKPEVTEELEVGFDAALLDQRMSLEVSYYDKTTRDAIIPRPALPSLGFPGTQFVNLGRVSNKGAEFGATAEVVRGERWGWQVRGKFSTTANKIEDMASLRPPIFGTSFAGQRNVEGYPVASVFLKKVVHAEFDANNQLVNVLCEGGDPITGGGPPVPCAQAGTAYFGYPTPSWDAALGTSLRIRNLTLEAFAEGQGGNVKCDGDIAWAHVFFRDTYAINARTDPILAAYDQLGAVCQAGLVKAGFAKLRNLSATYQLPMSWTRHLGVDRASVTVSAQNMFTLWVEEDQKFGHPVIDPEVYQNSFNGLTAYQQDLWPQFQRVTATLRVAF